MHIKWGCPKVDNHCHLGGMVPPETVYSILNGITLEETKERMIMKPEEIGLGFDFFLKKFEILNEIKWTEDNITSMINDVCTNITNSGTKIINISLSINKYVDSGFSIKGACEHILDLFDDNCKQSGIYINPLLSLRYDSPLDVQKKIIKEVCSHPNVFDRFRGIDLVGKESAINVEFYKPIFEQWREAGKILRAHAGELPGTSDNVYKAIYGLKVDRIAHGIYANDDVLSMAADLGVVFDLALHSNLYTSAIVDMSHHPIRNMMARGCRVTLSTDDPIQFNCTLDDEYEMALKHGLLNEETKDKMMVDSYKHSIIPNLVQN